MNPNIQAQEVVAAFQRYLANNDISEIDEFTLEVLRNADEQLGQKDVGASFRIAIQNRIKELELKEAREYDSKIRAWNLITGVLIGVIVASIAGWLFNT